MIIGRKEELKLFSELMNSNRSEFVAVYGRRRVGKTFLIREAFNYQFTFQHTGVLDAPLTEQLVEFRESLYSAGMKQTALPKTWSETFIAESGTSKAVQLTMVTPFGLVSGGYADDIQCNVTMDDLFL